MTTSFAGGLSGRVVETFVCRQYSKAAERGSTKNSPVLRCTRKSTKGDVDINLLAATQQCMISVNSWLATVEVDASWYDCTGSTATPLQRKSAEMTIAIGYTNAISFTFNYLPADDARSARIEGLSPARGHYFFSAKFRTLCYNLHR